MEPSQAILAVRPTGRHVYAVREIDMLIELAKENPAMIVIMRATATEENIDAIIQRLKEYELQGRLIRGEERTIIGVVGAAIPPTLQEEIERFEGVQETARITRPYKLAAREFHPHDTVVDVRGVKVGDGSCVVIAGPCAVESEEQIMATARAARDAGANMLRGGAFKPRSSPYTFRGMGEEALQLMAKARAETGLPIVTEVMTPTDVPLVARYADIWNAVFVRPEEFQARNESLDGMLRDAGRAPEAVRRTLMTALFFGKDGAALKVWIDRLRERNAELAGKDDDAVVAYARANAPFIIGQPEQVRQQLAAYAAAGVSEILLQWLDLDDIDGLRAFAEVAQTL